jgi:hypothetical protein
MQKAMSSSVLAASHALTHGLRGLVLAATLALLLSFSFQQRAEAVGGSGGAQVTVCGTVNAFTAATNVLAGSLSIGPAVLVLAPSTTLANQASLVVGQPACVTLFVDAGGQVTGGQVTAGVNAGASIKVCGLVGIYTAATNVLPGSLTLNGVVYVIAIGGTLANSGLLTAGANVCVDANLNGSGQIANGTVAARATVTGWLTLCGNVSAYTAATALTAGSITIGGQTFVIAPSAALTGPNIVTGNNYCIDANTNVAGEIVNGQVSGGASATANVSICGKVDAFQAATAGAPGSITINGQTFSIATNTTLAGQNAIVVGGQYCLDGQLNGSGQIQNGQISAQLKANASVKICGTVTAYTAATGTSAGSITVGGQTFTIAQGATLTGPNIVLGSNYCITFDTNVAGEVVGGKVGAGANATGRISICGRVDAFLAATVSTNGSITIGGQTFVIMNNTTLANQNTIVVGAQYCLDATANAQGEISNGQINSRVTVAGSLSICGIVSAFTAATATSPGSITINGQTFVIAPGMTLSGQGGIITGNSYCLSASQNTSGEILGGSIALNNTSSAALAVCGRVDAFSAATNVNSGDITMGGETFTIATNADIGTPTLQQSYQLNATTNASNQIVSGSLTLQPGGCLGPTAVTVVNSTATPLGSLAQSNLLPVWLGTLGIGLLGLLTARFLRRR